MAPSREDVDGSDGLNSLIENVPKADAAAGTAGADSSIVVAHGNHRHDRRPRPPPRLPSDENNVDVSTTKMMDSGSTSAAASRIDKEATKFYLERNDDDDDDDHGNDAAHKRVTPRGLELIENHAPLPTPQIAISSFEAINDYYDENAKYLTSKNDEAALKRAPKKLELKEDDDENAPPVPVELIAASLETITIAEDVCAKKNKANNNDSGSTMLPASLDMIEGNAENDPLAPVPIEHLAALFEEAMESSDKNRKKTAGYTQQRESANQDLTIPLRLAAPSTSTSGSTSSTRQVYHSHVTPTYPAPIPTSTDNVGEELLPPPYPVIEATLIDDVVYDAIPYHVDQQEQIEKYHPGSWWTRRRIKCAIVGFASAAVAVSVGAYYASTTRDSRISRRTPTNTNSVEWKARGQLLVGGKAYELFGSSASLSANGHVLAIGNDADFDAPCYVQLYYWPSEGSKWEKIGGDIINDIVDSRLGCSVSLSGDGKTLAMGSEENDNSPGHVTLYSITSSSWIRIGKISGEALADSFGISVSLSVDGRTLAVGAYRNSGNGHWSGHVRVFQTDDSGSDWTQLGKDIDGESERDESGYSVSLSADGRVIAIGSPKHMDAHGQVRVYSWNVDGSTWEKRGKALVGDQPYDNFGNSVSISGDGNTVVAGGPANGGDNRKGYARIFYFIDDEWQMRGTFNGSLSGGAFGQRVFLSGDGKTVAISDPFSVTENNMMNGGRVSVYGFNDSTPNTNSWSQRGNDINGEAAFDNFGKGLSLSADGKVVAIGSPYGNGNGTIRVFELDN